jgi:hypothetical protein
MRENESGVNDERMDAERRKRKMPNGEHQIEMMACRCRGCMDILPTAV